MSILIQSEDVDTGTSYDGTWQMSTAFSGLYEVHYVFWETVVVPWIWHPIETIKFSVGNREFSANLDYAALRNATNTTTIATSFQTTFNNTFNAGHDPDPDVTFTCSYNVSTNDYLLGVTNQTNANIVVQLLWSDAASTASAIFDKVADETSGNIAADQSFVFNLSAQHVGETSPKFLLMAIDECSTRIIGSCSNDDGTIVISTSDMPITGQLLRFNRIIKDLNIGIYRTNITSDTVPVSNKWNLVLKPN